MIYSYNLSTSRDSAYSRLKNKDMCTKKCIVSTDSVTYLNLLSSVFSMEACSHLRVLEYKKCGYIYLIYFTVSHNLDD